MLQTILAYLPSAFFALVLAHFVALISPGADFFLIVGQAVRNGFKGSVWICVGIAVANGVYIILTIIGWSAIKHYPLLFTVIECLGVLYLCWIGYLLIKSSLQQQTQLNEDGAVRKALSASRQFVAGFLSGILNPKNFIFYISLMTSILGSDVTLGQQIVCGIWMFMAVLLWDMMMAYAVGHPKVTQRFTDKIWLVERGLGVVLMIIALGIALTIFKNMI